VLAAARGSRSAHNLLRVVNTALCADMEVVLAAVSHNCENFQHASPELRSNHNVILAALSKCGDFVEPRMTCDQILDSIEPDVRAMLFQDRDFGLAAVRCCTEMLMHLHDTLKADREVVTEAVRYNGDLFRYASDILRNDKGLVLAAMECGPYAFDHASESLRGDKEVVLAALQACTKDCESDYSVLPAVTAPALFEDREVILAAIECNHEYFCIYPESSALALASEALKADRDVVHAAVAKDPYQMAFAAESLRGDRAYMLAVLRDEPFALEHASVLLRQDRKVVIQACTTNGLALQHAEKALHDDKEVVLAALKYWRQPEEHHFEFNTPLGCASTRLQDDKAVVLAAVSYDGDALHDASPRLCKDQDVLKAALVHGKLHPADVLPSTLVCNEKWMLSVIYELQLEAHQTVHLKKVVSYTTEQLQSVTAMTAQSAEQLQRVTATTAQLWDGCDSGTATNIEIAGADGQRLAAHRDILSLRSPVFRTMFQSGFKEAEQVGAVMSISDVDTCVLKEMLRFLYTGSVQEHALPAMALPLFELGNKYEVEGLQALAQQSLVKSLDVENAINVIVVADQHSAGELKGSVTTFICKHWDAVMATEAARSMRTERHPVMWELFEANEACARGSRKRQREEGAS